MNVVNGRLMKRAFDIIFSLFVIVLLLSWLLPILAILILLDSRGPVFFIQRRVGMHGNIFPCIKLRTMVVNAQADVLQASACDPRITPLGRFLRKSSLDELPQFFNVLWGHMSVVGPRPHMIRDCRDFASCIEDYHARHRVKPGITGMAQVKGCRGKTENFQDVFRRYQWDMFYLRNQSMRLDLRIIHTTCLQVWESLFPAPAPRPVASERPTFAA